MTRVQSQVVNWCSLARSNREEMTMQNVDRRSAVALALAVASIAVTKPGNAQPTGSPAATETSPFPGVVIRSYGEEHSLSAQDVSHARPGKRRRVRYIERFYNPRRRHSTIDDELL